MSRSDALYAQARRVTPGGVHSPVRSLGGVGTSPRFMRAARGAWLWDVDGRRYLDFCMAFGPLLLGHRNDAVRHAARVALEEGWSFGAADPYSLELAELITARIPWVEQVRFVNSGTEAVMAALRLARAATGRDKIVLFSGCYHGHSDGVLMGPGPGLAHHSRPISAGVPASVSREMFVLPLDDEDALADAFRRYGRDIAAAIIEPLPANHGLLPQRRAFLERLRAECTQHGALVIFDEVISGFRLAFAGFAGWAQLEPDLVTYGKVLGGGFPIGAFGGRRELMELLAPAGTVYQAGTFSANPLSMRAGLATLTELEPHLYRTLSDRGARLACAFTGHPGIRVQQVGSLFWLHLGGGRLARSPTDIVSEHAALYRGLFPYALARGIYLPPSPLEVGFLSTAHTETHIDMLVEVVSAWWREQGQTRCAGWLESAPRRALPG